MTVRSMGFGAMAGGGSLAAVKLFHPNLFEGNLDTVLFIGSLLGCALHSFISRIFDALILGPFRHFFDAYGKLLMALPFFPLISKEQRQLIIAHTVWRITGAGPEPKARLAPIEERSLEHDPY